MRGLKGFKCSLKALHEQQGCRLLKHYGPWEGIGCWGNEKGGHGEKILKKGKGGKGEGENCMINGVNSLKNESF